MHLVIQDGALLFLDEKLLTVIKKSLVWAKRHVTTPTLLSVYGAQIKCAKKFLVSHKKSRAFGELPKRQRRRLMKILAAHQIFLDRTKA